MEWDREALVPVTLTWNVWADANVHESVDIPAPGRVVGERVQKVLLVVRHTTTVQLLRAATVIVEVPDHPALAVTQIGVASIVKSWTEKVPVTAYERA